MENITLKWISDNITFLVTFIGGLWAVYMGIKKIFNKGLEPVTKKITELGEKIDNVEKHLKEQLNKLDIQSTKNFLVSVIDDVKSGKKIDPITHERFWEEYEHYVEDLNGNSYIKNEVEKLKSKKKL